jgi:hypothetical protein
MSLPLSLSSVGQDERFAASPQVTSLYIECTNVQLKLTDETETCLTKMFKVQCFKIHFKKAATSAAEENLYSNMF